MTSRLFQDTKRYNSMVTAFSLPAAVDNPEYFHMAGDATSGGAGAAAAASGETHKPPVPPRKTPPAPLQLPPNHTDGLEFVDKVGLPGPLPYRW